MNYEKLYITFCSEYQKTTPRERLLRRHKDDKRLLEPKLYEETHHILPVSLGGSDDPVNLVRLLPEEHLFLHRLRYKAYGDRQDFLSVRFIINGFVHKALNLDSEAFSKKFSVSYGWFRQNCYDFRKTHGWQTEEGLKSISEYRKGKIPGRCIKTGEILGEFDVNDPKVLSGEVVHHSKGRHSYLNPETGEKIFCLTNERPEGFISNHGDVSGTKNPRYSNITDEEIFNFYKNVSCLLRDHFNEKELPSLKFVRDIWNSVYDRKLPHLVGGLRSGFRFNGDIENLFGPLVKETGMIRSKRAKTARRLTKEEVLDAYNRIFG